MAKATAIKKPFGAGTQPQESALIGGVTNRKTAPNYKKKGKGK